MVEINWNPFEFTLDWNHRNAMGSDTQHVPMIWTSCNDVCLCWWCVVLTASGMKELFNSLSLLISLWLSENDHVSRLWLKQFVYTYIFFVYNLAQAYQYIMPLSTTFIIIDSISDLFVHTRFYSMLFCRTLPVMDSGAVCSSSFMCLLASS